MRGNVSSFSVGIFYFLQIQDSGQGGKRMSRNVSTFPSARFIFRKSKMAFTMANSKCILEGEGLQGCGLGMRRGSMVRVRGEKGFKGAG